MIRLLALILLLAVPAAAQETRIVVPTLGIQSHIAAPPWTNMIGAVSDSEIKRTEGSTQFGTQYVLYEYIPKGQDFDDWSELYAIFAEAPLGGETALFRDGLIEGYADVCIDLVTLPVADEAEQQIFIIVCPAYRDDPSLGEISIMHYRTEASTLVRNYYHRRGAAFDAGNRATWPMSDDDISNVLNRLRQFDISSDQLDGD